MHQLETHAGFMDVSSVISLRFCCVAALCVRCVNLQVAVMRIVTFSGYRENLFILFTRRLPGYDDCELTAVHKKKGSPEDLAGFSV